MFRAGEITGPKSDATENCISALRCGSVSSLKVNPSQFARSAEIADLEGGLCHIAG